MLIKNEIVADLLCYSLRFFSFTWHFYCRCVLLSWWLRSFPVGKWRNTGECWVPSESREIWHFSRYVVSKSKRTVWLARIYLIIIFFFFFPDYQFIGRSKVSRGLRDPLRPQPQLLNPWRADESLGHPDHRGSGKCTPQIQGEKERKKETHVLEYYVCEFWGLQQKQLRMISSCNGNVGINNVI